MHPREAMQSVSETHEDAALRAILEGTATATGEEFFRQLVRQLAEVLGTCGAWVTEYVAERRCLKALAFWLNGEFVEDFEYDITGTPCEQAIERRCLLHIPDNIIELFPADGQLSDLNAVSYMGVPLLDIDGEVLGLLAVLGKRPLPEEARYSTLFQIFAARAAAEHRRLRAEKEVREREQKLSILLDSAMDAIIEMDPSLKITLNNSAASRILDCPTPGLTERAIDRFLAPQSAVKLRSFLGQVSHSKNEKSTWIPGGLTMRRGDGSEFSAEATLSQIQDSRQPGWLLVLRDVNERVEAERRIEALKNETEYLREELRSLHDVSAIIGASPALQAVLEDVARVAPTNATVLIAGETGTGKELIARAIHAASDRRERPLIKVNCAAVSPTLIESEFFGHEKGAFTGATSRRDGRFALADGGTIFLDEIGEMPLDLQVKLLRVLQEGEFEPVGSSRTRQVDVRVIAATNRDLEREVSEGRFREDLFYRLSVFPIRVPPLRERPEDIVLLAEAFAQRCARESGRLLLPLCDQRRRRLTSYNWPGNVRELQNVIERAVITSTDGRLNLDRALPEPEEAGKNEALAHPGEAEILTCDELRELERRNIIRALNRCEGRVSGTEGAARLLGMNPSTLASRIKALNIDKSNIT